MDSSYGSKNNIKVTYMFLQLYWRGQENGSVAADVRYCSVSLAQEISTGQIIGAPLDVYKARSKIPKRFAEEYHSCLRKTQGDENSTIQIYKAQIIPSSPAPYTILFQI